MARGGPGVSKRTWFQAEDDRLVELVKALGVTSWIAIAGEIGGGRNSKQCRERWHNHLDPDVKKGPWTAEEDATILAEVRRSGFKWNDIARILPGRSTNAVRNRFLRFPAETRRAADSGELLTMGADANTAIPLPAAVAHPIAPIGVGWEPSNPHAAAVASMPAAVAVAAIPAAVLQLTPGVQYTGFPLHGQIV